MIKKILRTRNYKAGYIVHTELVNLSETEGVRIKDSSDNDDFEIFSAYTLEGHYIGSSVDAYRLCKKRGIKPELANEDDNVCSIGFSEREQKWYGWSHRAIYGFGIGDSVVKGDCAYIPSTVDELYDNMVVADKDGYVYQKPENVEKMKDGVRIRYKTEKHTIEDPDTGELSGWVDDEPEYQVIETGCGEWTAKNLEDCKQMAIAFADGVG